MKQLRNLALALTGLCLVAGVIYFVRQHPSMERSTASNPVGVKEESGIVSTPSAPIGPALKTKGSAQKGVASVNPLEAYGRVPLRNAPEHLLLVENVLASNIADLPLSKITVSKGMSFYQRPADAAQVPGALPVVYNAKTGEYGMLSGEVVFRHSYARAKSFAEKNGITIVYDDPKAYMLIVREDDLERLQDLLGETELAKSKPRLDVIYYLNQPK